jgi:hypothetical protein
MGDAVFAVGEDKRTKTLRHHFHCYSRSSPSLAPLSTFIVNNFRSLLAKIKKSIFHSRALRGGESRRIARVTQKKVQ